MVPNWHMATGTVFGPVAPVPMLHDCSTASSSPPSTATSSESPTPTTTFAFSPQYANDLAFDDRIPKIEEIEDDVVEDGRPGSLPEADDASPSEEKALQKRPRGRPRKQPKEPTTVIVKPVKGRSKTGCITCRRRKKKCDETKPECNHCIKNNVTCEGYPPREYWQSGKQRLMKARRSSLECPRSLPTLIDGVENDLDWFLLNHFQLGVSKVLSLCMDRDNPFKEIFLPMAMQHKGLMHSLLCLAGTHIITKEENLNLAAYLQRQRHHYDLAIKILRTDRNLASVYDGDTTAVVDDPILAQTVVLCLNTITAGDSAGEYRTHMDIAKRAMQQTNNNDFQGFIYEFFVYHDVSNSITAVDRPNILMSDDFHLPEYMMQQPALGNFLGVMDGLFFCMSRIRRLRDNVRARSQSGAKPLVDFDILSEAQGIDHDLREWRSTQPEDTPRWTLSMLYRQCTWIYLHRTILPSVPNNQLRVAVDEGLELVRELPADSSTQSLILMPLFLLGCAAFQPYQRPDICQALDNLTKFSNLGNIVHAREILAEVWRRMDAGVETWDWESIMKEMGLDLLLT